MSNLTQDMASPRAVRDWCRLTCNNYPDVDIKNMSTSFRDGLAFCAIIHSHRPDLIDFSSLSKDNGYENNKMAFEIAERKLGIPALLEPKDMVSKAPDGLSVISYLSQYYYFFNRKSYAGLTSLRSSHVTFLNSLAKSKTPNGLKRLKSQTDMGTSREDRLSNTRPRTVCHVCFKPVHLIQRHLTDGKVYHRSCFRCKVCHSTLLPESYTWGSDDGSLICTHHITDRESTRVDLEQIGSTDNRPKSKFQAGYFSLGGLAISSVPHYTKTTESQDRLVCKTPEMEGRERGLKDRDSTVGLKCTTKKLAPPPLPPPSAEDRTVKRAEKAGPASLPAESKTQQEETKTRGTSELSSPCARVTEESSRPVPAPRQRTLDPSEVPVPVPRTKAAPPMNSSPALGNLSNQKKCSSNSSHITSPRRDSPKVQTNHPWINIIHPGPWTQLPPAPPPVPAPRSKSVSNMRRSWNRPRGSPPNPFGEEGDEDAPKEPEPADQTETSSGNGGTRKNTSGDTDAVVCSSEDSAIKSTPDDVGASSGPARETSQLLSDLDETGNTKGFPPDVTEAAAAEPCSSAGGAQSHILPRSLSVPAITSARSQSSPLPSDLTEATETDQVVACRSKLACKENPFDRKPAMPKSKTCQELPSARASAPGHGFPLIKRKVQTDQNVSTEELQVEVRELEKHLEALEQKGVELEENLRDLKNDEDQEQMLMEWFSLIHEKHALMRRDTELVHLTKQQKLEERQADVEYKLRCLLNKPVSDWSREDQGGEQQLMDELVAIIEQRNQIISSLDQDRQRERDEDMRLEAMMTNKEIQKEGLKELKKSKGKFKPAKMFKMLNHKAESNKDSMDKKS